MSNGLKGIIVVVLVVAVIAVISRKQHAYEGPAAAAARATSDRTTPPPAKPAPAKARAATQQPAPPAKAKRLPQMIELGGKTCTVCQAMEPILEELRKEYQGQLEVPFWDIYEHPDKAKAYKIRVIPTQVFVDADGNEFSRHEGFFPKEDILKTFQDHGIVLSAAK
jgi:thioredoxin 1